MSQGKGAAVADASGQEPGRPLRAGRARPLSAARPRRPADRFLSACPPLLLVGGARRAQPRRRLSRSLAPVSCSPSAPSSCAPRAAPITTSSTATSTRKVARTRGRPLPSGQVTLQAAVASSWSRSVLIGLARAAELQHASPILLGLGVLPIVALYPFVKRFSHWPQVVLGLAFNWGALHGLGGGARRGSILAPVILYAGAVAWTIGYDTIYAHQDREDDDLIGLQIDRAQIRPRHASLGSPCSTLSPGSAITVGRASWPAPDFVFLLGMIAAGAQLAWQVATPRHRRCGELPGALPVEPRFRRSSCSPPSCSTWRSLRVVT